MFTVIVISLRDDGRSFFDRVFGRTSIVSDLRACFQMLLRMWLKQKEFWKCIPCEYDDEAVYDEVRIPLYGQVNSSEHNY